MNLKEERSVDATSGATYKHPVFDGENPNDFKNWWDNVFATLEMNDLEEYVTEDWKGKKMPDKTSAIVADADKSDAAKVAVAENNKLVRK